MRHARGMMRAVTGTILGVSLALLALAGCSASSNSPSRGGQATQGSAAVGGGAATAGAGSSGTGSFGNSDASIPIASAGGPAPVPRADGADGGTLVRDQSCGKILAIVRDFTPDTNPDFEIPFDLNTLLQMLSGQGQKGIVKQLPLHDRAAHQVHVLWRRGVHLPRR